MQVPSFIQSSKEREQFSNLMINCTSADSFRDWLLSLAIHTKHKFNIQEIDSCSKDFLLVNEYTYLSPYYFSPSKNDIDNSLKYNLTKTYTSRREYTYPICKGN